MAYRPGYNEDLVEKLKGTRAVNAASGIRARRTPLSSTLYRAIENKFFSDAPVWMEREDVWREGYIGCDYDFYGYDPYNEFDHLILFNGSFLSVETPVGWRHDDDDDDDDYY